MQWELVEKFIKWQAIALSPICPHVAEHIWELITQSKESSILNQRWPPSQSVDEMCIKKSEYLMEAAREFRLKFKSATAPPKAKKGKNIEVESPKKPTHATLYVAKTYPPWQCHVLTKLKEMYSNISQPPDNKAISQEMAKIPELKKWMKKVMPFVAFTKDRVQQVGMSALGKSELLEGSLPGLTYQIPDLDTGN